MQYEAAGSRLRGVQRAGDRSSGCPPSQHSAAAAVGHAMLKAHRSWVAHGASRAHAVAREVKVRGGVSHRRERCWAHRQHATVRSLPRRLLRRPSWECRYIGIKSSLFNSILSQPVFTRASTHVSCWRWRPVIQRLSAARLSPAHAAHRNPTRANEGTHPPCYAAPVLLRRGCVCVLICRGAS